MKSQKISMHSLKSIFAKAVGIDVQSSLTELDNEMVIRMGVKITNSKGDIKIINMSRGGSYYKSVVLMSMLCFTSTDGGKVVSI